MKPLVAALLCAATLAGEPAPSAALLQGIDAYNSGDFATAFRLLSAAADRGEPEAMVNLGYMYVRGQGVAVDADHSLALYRRAAAAGDGQAMNAIGYRFNFATTPDYANAITWYCRAIESGDPRAMNNLAIMALNGQGMERDREEARHLWRQASARGSLNARTNLGLDLASDPASPDSVRREGFSLLRDAALRGGAYAQDILRKNGDTEAFPPATVTSGTMVPEQHDAPPGSTRICGRVIS